MGVVGKWGEIEIEYVYGKEKEKEGRREIEFPTLAELAERYKVGESTIGKVSKKNGWLVKRELWIKEKAEKDISEKRRERFIEKNKRAGRSLQQIEAVGKVVDYYLGRWHEVIEYENMEDQFEFEGIVREDEEGKEVIPRVSIKDLKMVTELVEKNYRLTKEILEEEKEGKEIVKDVERDKKEKKEKVNEFLRVMKERGEQNDELEKKRERKITAKKRIQKELREI